MMESASISICNQKGGVGKSSLTVLLASYLHYTLGHDVLVMDCDYPQCPFMRSARGNYLFWKTASIIS